MSLSTEIWLIIAGICIGMAAVYLMVWLKSRQESANLFFSISTLAAAWMALIELDMMHTQTAVESGVLLHWYNVSVSITVIGLVWFIYSYLKAGSQWLAWLITGIRALSILVGFLPGRANTLFIEMDVPHQIVLWGEKLWVPRGMVTSSWWHLNNVSSSLFLVFLIGALITTWRRGDRRRVMVLGGALSLAFCLGFIKSILIHTNELALPYTLSLFFLVFVIAMVYELSTELARSATRAQKLQQSEQGMRLAAEAANLVLWEWNVHEDEIRTMTRSREQTGLRTPYRGTLDHYLDTIHPADREQTQKAIIRALESDGEYQTVFRRISPEGKTRWFSVHGQLEYDAHGKPLLLRGVSQDITARKEVEIELQEGRRELAHVARVSTMGQLSTALAHEINQPLGAILRNTEAAELFLKKSPPDLDELREIILDIRMDDQRAVSVIERMRALLKRRELHFEPLAVNELVSQVAQLLRTEIQSHNATLQNDIPDGLPDIYGDRVHLQQVLLNLFLNSLDAFDDTTEGQRNVIVRASQSTDEMLELEVIDSGSGIAPELLPHLFEPFHTTKANGTGIGLAISKTIIEMHGGRITAENNPHGGATVRFTLKTAQQEAGA